jgi:hypothetical protein
LPYHPANEFVCLITARTCALNEDPLFVSHTADYFALVELVTAAFDTVVPVLRAPRDLWRFHLAADLIAEQTSAKVQSYMTALHSLFTRFP